MLLLRGTNSDSGSLKCEHLPHHTGLLHLSLNHLPWDWKNRTPEIQRFVGFFGVLGDVCAHVCVWGGGSVVGFLGFFCFVLSKDGQSTPSYKLSGFVFNFPFHVSLVISTLRNFFSIFLS